MGFNLNGSGPKGTDKGFLMSLTFLFKCSLGAAIVDCLLNDERYPSLKIKPFPESFKRGM